MPVRTLGNRISTRGKAPYGYVLKDKELVADSAEQSVILLIITLREQGQSYRQIAKTLKDMQIKTKHSCNWASETVRKIYKAATDFKGVTVDVECS